MAKLEIKNKAKGLWSMVYGLWSHHNLKTIDYRLSAIDLCIFFLSFILCLCFWVYAYAQENKEGPIVVNGDKFEYSTDNKEVTVMGNVEVIYKGSKLTCQKITLNTETKDAQAEGNARLDDQQGVIEGQKIIYNFQAKVGTIIDSQFRANPYFGRGKKVEKVSDTEFIAYNGYATTCSLDYPHYRIRSKQIKVFPQDKIQTRHDTFYLGKAPLLYLPRYNHSLKDPFMHVQFVPGKSKDWGPYLLSATRYNLTEHISGRVYFDYREQLGVAEGFGANYDTRGFGKGDFKYYYTQERSREFEESQPAEFQRYLIRLRHKWDIDIQTNLTCEYYKIADSKRAIYGSPHNLLKDYFFREYETDSQPLSYALLHHNFKYSSLDFMLQKRINRWYSQLEKLPEIKYSLPSYQLGQTPFYFENSSQAASFNYKNAVPSPSNDDIDVLRIDSANKFSLPLKVAFVNLTPFVKSQETYYNKNVYGASTVLRSVFYTGTDASTKFYRIFNVKSNFLGMDISGLRHIITPTIGYAYNHEPTVLNSKLRQIDSLDSIGRSNSAALGLSNKLQTKRKGQSVDLLDFNITSTYVFKAKSGDKKGSNLSDFLFEINVLPYSWLRIDADTTYKHSGSRSDENYKHFSNANYDINFDFGKERSFGIGQRYQRKGGNQITYNLNWRLSPKWRFSIYNRFESGHDPALKTGLREQEYSVSRDLHCWTMDVNYNVKRGFGETIWLVFRLKAFPELEFGFDQSYHQPKPGSQQNP